MRPQADSGTPRTILLVEHEQLVRQLVCHLLKKEGYNVLATANAEEATHQMEKAAGRIDLLLVSPTLPKMAGTEFAEWLQSRMPWVPVVLMSCLPDKREIAMNHGWTFLQKPFHAKELWPIVSRLCRPQRADWDRWFGTPCGTEGRLSGRAVNASKALLTAFL